MLMHRLSGMSAAAGLVLLAFALPLQAQSRANKQLSGTPVVSGPAVLEANMTAYGAWLRWSPVPNATGYNVTRVTVVGTAETLIASRATAEYAFEGNNCVAGSALPHCVYFDNQFRTTAAKLSVTYRVYAIIPGPRGAVTSTPSPATSLVWHCPNCPKLP